LSNSVKCRIEQGKIIPPTDLELIVSDHCNISCRQCNHLSPIARKWYVDAKEADESLSILAQIYRPRRIKLIGGEPLLHPRLPELIRTIRKSQICDHIALITNGLLLDGVDNETLTQIDEVELSAYPGTAIDEDKLTGFRRRFERLDIDLNVSRFPDFRRTFSRHTNHDKELVRDIFASCKIAQVWGCHALYKGKMYRCPQSIYAPLIAEGSMNDGLLISDDPDFQHRLLAMLNSDTPLDACANCLGTAGKKQKHALLSRNQWRSDLDMTIEEGLDRDLLKQQWDENSHIDDCKTPMKVRNRISRYRNQIRNKLVSSVKN